MSGAPGGGSMQNLMGIMAKMPAISMAFMVTVPALLGLGVGFAIGRAAKLR